MKILIFISGLFLLSINLFAQESREEKIRYTNPVDEYKENSNYVPEGYSIKGNFERIEVFRFKYMSDLLTGIDSLVKMNNIKNAVILSGIGSVKGFHIHTVSNSIFPSKNMFVKNPKFPADILSMNGYVINGKVHAHITLANPDKSFGGHLEYGTEVFTFAIVTLGVFDENVNLENMDNKHYR